jgi:hypothetical protein
MATTQQTPAVVIAARNSLITTLGEVAGGRTQQQQREALADWLITSGHLAESFYDGIQVGPRKTEASD